MKDRPSQPSTSAPHPTSDAGGLTELSQLAHQLAQGQLTVDQFLHQVKGERNPGSLPVRTGDLGDVTLDLDRQRRCGFSEVVFGQGKPVELLQRIIQRLLDEKLPVLVTRLAADDATALVAKFPQGHYHPIARTFRIRGYARSAQEAASPALRPLVGVITAGSTDRPIAEEARETLEWMGARVALIQDVGVAGPHRLPARLAEVEGARAIVVVAGMEGTLPSVVGGHVRCPVIGVPTSVGYGAHLSGIAPLLAMLNSCAANVTAVNIDAGFKGAYLAGLIALGPDPVTPRDG